MNGKRTPGRFFVLLFLVAGLASVGAMEALRLSNGVRLSFVVPWQYAFLGVIAGGLALCFLFRVRSRLAWESVMTVVLFLGVWYVLLLLLPFGWAIGLACGLTLLHLFFRRVVFHDLFYLVGSLGVAVDFAGWLSPEFLLLLLVALTVYDTVAGPPGGMIETLAKHLVRQGMVPGFILVPSWRDLLRHADDVVKRDAALLGAGDVVLPLSLVTWAAMRDVASGLFVLGGTVLAAALFVRDDATARPRAALPALAAGTAIPFVLLRLFDLV